MTATTPVRIVIDGNRAIELIEQAVAERGHDYVYLKRHDTGPTCQYWHADEQKPGCIVGTALSLVGVSNVVLIRLDTEPALGSITSSAVQDILAASGVELDRDAIRRFDIAQAAQDGGRTWGKALERAKAPL